jgi:hypothetical protein
MEVTPASQPHSTSEAKDTWRAPRTLPLVDIPAECGGHGPPTVDSDRVIVGCEGGGGTSSAGGQATQTQATGPRASRRRIGLPTQRTYSATLVRHEGWTTTREPRGASEQGYQGHHGRVARE